METTTGARRRARVGSTEQIILRGRTTAFAAKTCTSRRTLDGSLSTRASWPVRHAQNAETGPTLPPRTLLPFALCKQASPAASPPTTLQTQPTATTRTTTRCHQRRHQLHPHQRPLGHRRLRRLRLRRTRRPRLLRCLGAALETTTGNPCTLNVGSTTERDTTKIVAMTCTGINQV